MSDLSAEAIAAALTTRRLGRPVLYFPRTGSTNDVAHERAAAGAAEGLLVIADEQTAGRGRLDRRWWAPPGSSLLMSLLLRPALPPDQAGQLTMCLGLAAVEAIEAVTGLRPALKWPNDLLLDERKLGGMLTDLRLEGERLQHAVLGLGVNVNVVFDEGRHLHPPAVAAGAVTPADQDDSSLVIRPPSELANTAISLSMALGHPVDRLALLAALLACCEGWYERVLAGESPHAAWAARLDTVGRRVTVTTATGGVAGIAVGVTPEGALLVRGDDAVEHVIWSGDVTALRRAA
jgi:BirA family biotin operon repressor/biotin-[acetyl-CoA-carboxylase] ligase